MPIATRPTSWRRSKRERSLFLRVRFLNSGTKLVCKVRNFIRRHQKLTINAAEHVATTGKPTWALLTVDLASLSDKAERVNISLPSGNISAVMINLGFPYIRGYKPRSNYQHQLAEVVASQVQTKQSLDETALAAVQQPAALPILADFARVKTDAPQREHKAAATTTPLTFRAVKRDYLEREAANRSLGLAGEEFVLQFEHWRLAELGQKRLAEKVQHMSKTQGDGLGYDILSFEADGRERLIEVKTTSFGKHTPFFVSRGELALSQQAKEQFHLYRLFEFRKDPRLFDLPGQLDHNCVLDPVTYRASFN